jgi:uncharacterized integral membrane protein
MLYVAIVLFALVTTGLAVLAFANFLNDVSLSLVIWHMPSLPIGWLLLLSYLLGAVMLFLIAAAAASRDTRELKRLRAKVEEMGRAVPVSAAAPPGVSAAVPIPGMQGSRPKPKTKPDISDMTTLH